MRFPNVDGENLDGEPLSFPRDFVRRTIILVAFDFKARDAIESWVPFVERFARAGTADGRVLAAIPRGMRMMQGMILATLRKAAPNAAARAVTVPVFVDLDAFCAALEVRDRSVIGVYVVDPDGSVLARRSGSYAAEAGAAIEASLEVTA